ncbi:MAG: mannose-1-phosphate guanylyltransferase/mannose-6-phosphate isomerase [Alphaproteobacteria bacterium]|nr:mannose-1-phosphate guanylyltransferase/mannose-6-phosphate isomerase [Alphaproteobacteria bacterium]
MKILPVILSGGSGTRLWPVSRSDYPKQLQRLVGDETLLQQTVLRLEAADDIMQPLIICAEDQRFLVAQQLQEKNIKASLIILEPTARSTAPALATAALWVQDPENTILVAMPADHHIDNKQAFLENIRHAAQLAAQGYLMTLGIPPTHAHTGYGYIERGSALDAQAFTVKQFKEKPDAPTAQAYLETGRYFWNAGIFVFRADHYLAALACHEPKVRQACQAALARARADLDFLRLDKEAFMQAPNISIDYAVMEKADNAGVLPASFAWNDIGSWQALWQIGDKDEHDNVIAGDVIVKDTARSLIQSEDRLIAALGLEDMLVIDTPDALFVSRLDKADEVKDIVAHIKEDGRSEIKEHLRVWRPWGYYERIDQGSRFQVKQIMVRPGGKLSLQKHHHRAEHWIVVSGTAKVQCGEEIKTLSANQSIYIPQGTKHRLENTSLLPLYLIEVQSGDYLGEDDIVRFEDIYARVEATATLFQQDDESDVHEEEQERKVSL